VLSEKLVRPQSETLGKINIVQTGYDSLIIQNSENLILKSRSVSIIRLFKKENSKFVLTSTQIPEYSGSYGSYTMKFKFKIYVPENVLFCNFKLQFVLFDSSKVEIDTSATTCQYPYKNAEIFYTYDELPYPEEKKWRLAEDIDFEGDKFYYRNSGGGIYEIDETTGACKIIFDYVAHNYIAVEAENLYYTVDPYTIYKLNLTNGNNTKFLQFGHSYAYPPDSGITGIEAEDEAIYITTSGGYLFEFDTSGNFKKSFPYSRWTYFLTKYENRLFSVDKDSYMIKVYNLTTQTFENDLLPPSLYLVAIRIKHGYFYYSDFKKRYIGKIPLKDIIR
jgi:hypothetical protein